VGKAALEGLNGVKKVEKGFRYLREVNTVYYDPEIITIEKMEMALKKSGTYMETIK
jgi:copper chaperone CopZ